LSAAVRRSQRWWCRKETSTADESPYSPKGRGRNAGLAFGMDFGGNQALCFAKESGCLDILVPGGQAHDLLQTAKECKTCSQAGCSFVIAEVIAGHRLKRQAHRRAGYELLRL